MHGKTQTHGEREAALVTLAEAQHRVIATPQLTALGITDDAIRHLVDTGWLHRKHRAVYVVGGRKLTPKGHWMAAVLTCGPTAVLSHHKAAALWEIRASSGPTIDVTIPDTCRAHRDGIRVHSTKTLHPEDITTLDGIPVTSLPRTLLDLAAVLKPQPLLRAIEEAERRDLFDLRAIDRAIARAPRRRGVKRLRHALARYRPPPHTRSDLERRALALIRTRTDLPEPLTNTIVAGCDVDLYWPQYALVVELDGEPYHTNPSAFERDRIKDATLQRASLAVLRITGDRLDHDEAGVLDDILALARRPRAA